MLQARPYNKAMSRFTAILAVLLAVALGGVSLAAQRVQAPAAKPEGAVYPIVSLRVEGNRHYTAEQILAASGLKTGQLTDPAGLEKARDELLASGVFESVGYSYGPGPEGKGYAVTFEVAEVEQRFPVRFEYFEFPAEQMLAYLWSRDVFRADTVPGTETRLKQYASTIERFLKENGAPQRVIGEITADRPDEPYILLRPAVPPPVIAEVRFLKTESVPLPELQDAIRGVAVGAVWRESRFRQLLDTSIRPLYEQRGLLQVRFTNIRTQPAEKVRGLIVDVDVEEGQAYTLGEVAVEGTPWEGREWLDAVSLTSQETADFDKVRAAQQRLVERLKRHGFMLATAAFERRLDEENKTAHVVLRAEPGPRFDFGRLYVKGLALLGEAEIRRIWGLEEGKPFNASYPDYFLQRVREEGIFDNLGKTRAELRLDQEKRLVDVTLYFE